MVLSACVDRGGASFGRYVGKAALDAAAHPVTWGGLAAGAAFALSGVDDDVSDWLADERPIFQKTETAEDVSDVLKYTMLGGMAVTGVFAPLSDVDEGGLPVGRRLGANMLAYGSNRLATDGLKAAFGRERPNEENDKSLPSGHTSTAFNAAASIERNLANVDLQPAAATASQVGLYGMAGATAWARLEAEKHFPSDVLIGAALGNFLARFAFGVIAGPSGEMPVTFAFEPDFMAFRLSHHF